MALRKKPSQTALELEYTVRKGISSTKLIEALATLAEADAPAIRTSLDRSYIVEVWHRDQVIAWYANGVRG
jgi:hypothetical protein